ncbi:MAG: type II toxin-antitoxin system prevent-host-death family antitoxin [Clostridium sp.]|nr:type II toxin-antitoxin system prevent-host-death family antitoxin [Clostridium sp.]
MPNIMPITDLRKTNEISDLCHKSQEPVFITKNGYGDLVVMSIEAYEKLVNDIQVDSAIMEAEKEVREGAELLDAREALAELRRKHGA